MSKIIKKKLTDLGYGFVPETYLQNGDEYFYRNQQFQSTATFRPLSEEEIKVLVRNDNFASNWKDVWVTDQFLPEQIQNSKFYGMVRIGDMDDVYLDFRDLRLPCGIYNSTIISCDFGSTVAVHNVRYMSHFIVGNDVMLANISEMETSSSAKFGNGILKRGDVEERRIRLELCNENGGRSVLPFDGMQAGDVFLWSRYREDTTLQRRFQELAEAQFSVEHGYYSEIGNHSIIKNTHTIKDVKIGAHAYIKGVNKLKNLTINSSSESYTQIGEGCELVNGIIGYGCRIFYGVKAVRFILSSNSQLKYGARLINSFLGDNSTISCCEVLNSLIFPAHEQHHNNSFLCAAVVKGQSNMAAGATVGSNHNSRAADGEIVAGRGFWPGLCVSLKHNSRFASYTLIVKGDFLHELDIKFPFCLVSNEVDTNRLVILPGYWFLYNMYALMRNTSKFAARDKRKFKNQYIEYDVLAPDTINEMFVALGEIETAVGKTFAKEGASEDERAGFGRTLLNANDSLAGKSVLLDNVEFSKRKVVLAKPRESYHVYKRMIRYYASLEIIGALEASESMDSFWTRIRGISQNRKAFENIGGQLIPAAKLKQLLDNVREGALSSWNDVHEHYHAWSRDYLEDRFEHAVSSLAEIQEKEVAAWDHLFLRNLLTDALDTKTWICSEIENARSKDYQNPFKQMIYNSYEEMEEVVGKLADNDFINKEKSALAKFEATIERLINKL
ncbi:DUF4954 family protein [Sphingobacterium deserti]|uniref:DUF4954 domain-containing protein n=1 Tax=Sphingobacterium deserti TaxID=1229276 RepID=A0A0B8T2I2_9SPHI|nr:DUF4954 family protein [Sphingobacterium deserti]KGE15111.1 hypothetical protein DI53_1109 [Sphingobacterium deserti]